jgi:hypothetical protein
MEISVGARLEQISSLICGQYPATAIRPKIAYNCATNISIPLPNTSVMLNKPLGIVKQKRFHSAAKALHYGAWRIIF